MSSTIVLPFSCRIFILSYGGKFKKTEFLNGTEFYISDKNCEGFIKDLKNTPSKFVAVMPKKGGVDELLKKLDGYSFTEL
jgi:hypothetical protein